MRLPDPAGSEARSLAQALQMSLTAADILHRRGFRDDLITRQFLAPKLAHLSSPEQMVDRAAGAARIAKALRAGERITIFGDYDCDGITSAAILTLTLRAFRGRVTTLLANRFAGGYGVSDLALD